MKLETIKIRNFRGYKTETKIAITDLTTFIGKNDAGKSSVLEALEIFFNSKLIKCERDDLNIEADGNDIEISCVFSTLPDELIIDAAHPTTLRDEHLLNADGHLEIKKVFAATAANPKEKVYIVCAHPSAEPVKDLLTLKRADLRARASALEINPDAYNANINASIRASIRNHIGEILLEPTELYVDKEDTKRVYEAIHGYLPLYVLFQSDRQSTDEDKEVTDPMKVAVQQALAELQGELDRIKEAVRTKAIETADRTLAKLNEMSPELAQELIPEFKTEPKFDSLFKLSIKSENGIAVNKRGSGVRRLILLNFFRAEAEKRSQESKSNHVIYAFEEPETSQHPNHQKILVTAFLELANSGQSQILLTTHTPALASLVPLESLRFIEKMGHDRSVEMGNDSVFDKVANTLGILADPLAKNATAILLVEGKSDVFFIRHTAEQLKSGGHIPHTFDDQRFAIVPVGGCGNLKHWQTMRLAAQFDIPYCVLIDSDKGTAEEAQNLERINQLRGDGIKAYATRKREPENYLHMDCLQLAAGSTFSFTETCDVKLLVNLEKGSRQSTVLEDYWSNMNCNQIREVEKYIDDGNERYEFSEMFADFLELVPTT